MNLRAIAAVAFVAAALLWPTSSRQTYFLPTKEPSAEMQETVRPVVRVVSSMSSVDRLWLQRIYINAARVVSADGTLPSPSIDTTDGLRSVHLAILAFVWRGLADNKPGKYPDLKNAIEAAFSETLGDSRRQLTPELRAKAVELFDAIAWAGLGKDG